MHLATEILHELDKPGLSVNERALLRCRLARQQEEAGDYEAASEAMAELWPRFGARPVVEGLDDETRAQVFCASVRSQDGSEAPNKSKAPKKWRRI